MAYVPPANDPFAPQRKTPSLSWKNLPPGSVFTLRVLEPAKLLQGTDYKTQQPLFWDEAKTQPKMNAVLNVEVLAGPHSVGEERSVWAKKPGDLFTAIANAQIEAGAQITTGGILYIRLKGETPHKDPKNNPIKNYEAVYEPPAPDVFTQPSPPAQPAPATPQPGMQTWGSQTAQPTPPRSW